MKNFYKIENGELHLGVGTKIPSGFIEYSKGEEPEELLESLKTQKQRVELQSKINEANQYLRDTDWVKDYKTRHDLGLEIIPEDSSKWLVINKRAECIAFLKSKGGN